MKLKSTLTLSTLSSANSYSYGRWRAMLIGVGVLLMLNGLPLAKAQLASQVIPVSYHTGQYCSTAIQPIIPKDTADRALIADISCLRQQLQPYQADSQPALIRYQAYKANAWLGYLAHETSEASLTKAKQYALAEALSILTALNTRQSDKLPITADIPPNSGLQRPDLWASLLTIKQTPAFAPLVKAVADSEVKLIWAEAEYCEFGWRHSQEHYRAADRWVSAAELTALQIEGVNKQQFTALKQQYLQRLLPLAKAENTKAGCQGTAIPMLDTSKS